MSRGGRRVCHLLTGQRLSLFEGTTGSGTSCENRIGEVAVANAIAESGVSKPVPVRLGPLAVSIIAICWLAYFLDGLVHTIMGPLAPEVASSLGLTRAQLGPIFSANLIGQCIGLVSLPFAARRIGHRLMVILTLSGFGIAQGVTSLAEGPDTLFWFRLVTGFFLGGALPSCMALVTAAAPPERRGIAIAILFTGYGLGCTVAGVVAGLFIGTGGWQAAMAIVGIFCVVSAGIAWRWLREPPVPVEDAKAAAASAQGVLAIVSRDYILGTLMLWVLFISMLTISYCLSSWLPTLLVDVGRDPAFAAISISTFGIGGIVSGLLVGALIDRFGTAQVLLLFMGMSVLLLFAVGQVMATAPGGLLLGLLSVCGFFVLGAYGGINVVLASYYPHSLRAIGIGWTKSVGRLGTILAPMLIGWGLSAGMAETTVMSLFAVPAAASLMAVIVITFAGRGTQ